MVINFYKWWMTWLDTLKKKYNLSTYEATWRSLKKNRGRLHNKKDNKKKNHSLNCILEFLV